METSPNWILQISYQLISYKCFQVSSNYGRVMERIECCGEMNRYKMGSALVLRKICQNTGFFWPVSSLIRTDSQILFLYEKMRARKNNIFWHFLRSQIYKKDFNECCIVNIISSIVNMTTFNILQELWSFIWR